MIRVVCIVALHVLVAAAVCAPFVVGRNDPTATYVFTAALLLYGALDRRADG